MNEYYEYFGPDYQLDVKASNTEDLNTPPYLERVKNIFMEHLRHVGGPPSVQMSGTRTPRSFESWCLMEHSRRPRTTDRRTDGGHEPGRGHDRPRRATPAAAAR